MAKNSNMTGAAEIIGPYIHSNVSLFFQNMTDAASILDPKNIDSSFVNLIDSIKKTLKEEVQQQINFLLGLETKLVNSSKEKMAANNQKPPFSDRVSFLSYLNTISSDLKESSEIQALVNVKSQMEITRKKFNSLLNELSKKIAQPLSDDEKKALKKRKEGKKLNNADLRRVQRADNKQSLKAENQKNFKTLQKEVNDIFDKERSFFKDHQAKMAKYYKELIIYANSVNDGYKLSAKKDEVNKTLKNAVEGILETAKSLGLIKDLKKITEKELQKFEQKILNLDPIKFFSIFYSNSAVDFINFQNEAFQVETKLGQIFEQALHDALLNFISKNPNLESVFNDIGLKGQISWLASYTAMDLSIASFTDEEKTINIGFSIKLKNEKKGDIKLEIGEPRFRLLMNQRDKLLGTSQKNKLDYITNNLLTLSIYRADKKGTEFYSKSLEGEINEILSFQRSIAQLLVLSRLLLGFWNKVGENQFNMAVGLKGDQTEELFYAAYLFDQSGIYSFASILENILKKFDFTDENKMKTIVTPGFKEISPFERVSKQTLEELYKRKKEAIKKFSGLASIKYNDIYSDSGVKSIMSEINSAFSNGFISSAAPEVKIKNIINIT